MKNILFLLIFSLSHILNVVYAQTISVSVSPETQTNKVREPSGDPAYDYAEGWSNPHGFQEVRLLFSSTTTQAGIVTFISDFPTDRIKWHGSAGANMPASVDIPSGVDSVSIWYSIFDDNVVQEPEKNFLLRIDTYDSGSKANSPEDRQILTLGSEDWLWIWSRQNQSRTGVYEFATNRTVTFEIRAGWILYNLDVSPKTQIKSGTLVIPANTESQWLDDPNAVSAASIDISDVSPTIGHIGFEFGTPTHPSVVKIRPNHFNWQGQVVHINTADNPADVNPVVETHPVADPDLVALVRHYWEINKNKPNRGINWLRVLIAFGAERSEDHGGLKPYTVKEAVDSEKIWSGWKPIREELQRLYPDPVTDDPVTDDPVTDDPVVDDPVVDDPVTDDPVVDDPVTDDPVVDDPVTDDPVVDDPVAPTDPKLVRLVRSYYEYNRVYSTNRGRNWLRVLIAFGVERSEDHNGLSPYTVKEARKSEKIWRGWKPIRIELERLYPDQVDTPIRTSVFPNPFNPATTIAYELSESANVTLQIYNVVGQVVQTLVASEAQNAGRYQIRWNGMDDRGMTVSSGIYFYRISIGKFQEVRKLMLLK